MTARMVLPVCVSILALIINVYSQSQFMPVCVEENGMCHQNWECCDKMMCSDHFGIGKCIPLTATYPASWPPAVSALPAPWYGPFTTLKPKKKLKKKKTKTKILIKVAGDLTGLTVKAKKKNNLLQSVRDKKISQ